MKPVFEIFRELTSVPTAPFFEQSVSAKALGWIRKNLRRRVRVTRHRGGIIVRYEGAGKGPVLALAAHLDHPAFKLSKITARGALGEMQGGLPAHLILGHPVQAFAARNGNNRPLAEGTLKREAKKGFYEIAWTRPPARGAKLAFATLALTPFSVEGRWLLSRSIDDLLGCAISLEAMRLAVKAGLKTNLSVFLHRAEEVGFQGALDLIMEGAVDPGDSVLSIETSRELPGSRPGRGPTIRLGDKACLFDPNLTALLDQAAAKVKPVQRLRLTGGTCEATAYQTFGYEAAGVAIPLVNYHNGWGAKAIGPEKVRREDVDGAVRLLVEAARLFPTHAALRGRLRERLAARHKSLVRFL